MDAAMDSRLALLERCLCDQLEGLRSEVEAGAVERAALRARLERLEGAMERMPVLGRASGERLEKKSPTYSCPPASHGEFAPASPPPAPRLARGRPPRIVIDVEDDDDDRYDDRYDRREPRRTERDADADDVIEEDDTEVPEHIPDDEVQSTSRVHVSTSPRGVIRDALLADIDAAEFEATLAGFRSRPAPLAANPFEGLADDEDEDEDDEASGTLQKPPEHPTGDQTQHRVSKEDEDEDAVHPSHGEKPRRHRGAVPAPPDGPPQPPPREETVEEMLAAIALEEEQRAARHRAGATGAGRGKKGNRKGNRKGTNVGQTSDNRQALVDAYLERRKAIAAASSFGDELRVNGEKLSKRKAVRWADETVPIAAVTGERIRAFVRATPTTALGARLDDVFGD